ncbi:hypothetical protein IWZ01DRAFT_164928 [Phyllosticta capitalensis]
MAESRKAYGWVFLGAFWKLSSGGYGSFPSFCVAVSSGPHRAERPRSRGRLGRRADRVVALTSSSGVVRVVALRVSLAVSQRLRYVCDRGHCQGLATVEQVSCKAGWVRLNASECLLRGIHANDDIYASSQTSSVQASEEGVKVKVQGMKDGRDGPKAKTQ